MSDPKEMMTTAQFAKRAGVSTATVSKWIRSGKVEGTKEGGKWMIAEDQLNKIADSSDQDTKTETPKAKQATKPTAPAKIKTGNGKVHSIEEFSQITYLTPFGVERYLKEGKLTGSKNSVGEWEVHASNLQRKEIKHLLR